LAGQNETGRNGPKLAGCYRASPGAAGRWLGEADHCGRGRSSCELNLRGGNGTMPRMSNDETSGAENRRFNLTDLADLARVADELGVRVDAQEDVSNLAAPVELGVRTLPNSLAIHPMEGCDGNGTGGPGPLTVRRYERFGAGGAGLVWFEATAVVPEGRANPRQLWINRDNVGDFAALVERTIDVAADRFGRSHRPMLVLQLTHSGRYCRPKGEPAGMLAQYIPPRDESLRDGQYRVVTDDYVDDLIGHYVTAAELAFEAGFDAVDIKACHGYLISDLLGARTREGKYGGPLANRMRFLLDVVDSIQAHRDARGRVTTRLGVFDAIAQPYGWGVSAESADKPDLTEPKMLMVALAARGVELVNVTVANPYYNPHYSRPFDMPVIGGYAAPEHPLVGVAGLIHLAGEIQKSFPQVAVMGTGYTWLRHLMPNVAAASKARGLATVIGVGRLALAYPDFAADIIANERLDPEKVCISCSGCSQIMRDGGEAGCIVRDAEIYRAIYKQGRSGR